MHETEPFALHEGFARACVRFGRLSVPVGWHPKHAYLPFFHKEDLFWEKKCESRGWVAMCWTSRIDTQSVD